VLINISGGHDLTLHEVAEAARIISDAVDPDANIISGIVIDPPLDEAMKVTVIATGFDRQGEDRPRLPIPQMNVNRPTPAPDSRPCPSMTAGGIGASVRSGKSPRRPRWTCPSTARR
jgi:cell division protein FtsZ